MDRTRYEKQLSWQLCADAIWPFSVDAYMATGFPLDVQTIRVYGLPGARRPMVRFEGNEFNRAWAEPS
jgi:hypothetical protein